jgi:hypothetical protein
MNRDFCRVQGTGCELQYGRQHHRMVNVRMTGTGPLLFLVFVGSARPATRRATASTQIAMWQSAIRFHVCYTLGNSSFDQQPAQSRHAAGDQIAACIAVFPIANSTQRKATHSIACIPLACVACISTRAWGKFVQARRIRQVIQAILRHSNVNATLGYYIKPQSEVVIAAMGGFEAEMDAQSLPNANGTSNPPSGAMPKSAN